MSFTFDDNKVYVLDGGFASACSERVSDIEHNPLWSSGLLKTNPELVRDIHQSFLASGADIICSNTYQSSPELFKKHLELLDNPAKESADLYKRSVSLADEAIEKVWKCKRYRWIAGSVGPYGACLGDGSEYNGDYIGKMSREDLKKWHFDRIRLLWEAGVDFLAVETIPSVVEALAILDVVESFPNLKCWISFQCRDKSSTARGEKFDYVVKEIFLHPGYPSRILAVGVNCVDPSLVSPLLKLGNRVNCEKYWPESVKFRKVPYVVYPNSGEKWNAAKKVWEGDKNPELILKHIGKWLKLGARIVGGCCRVSPDMISQIRMKISNVMLDCLEESAKKENTSSWETIQKQLEKPEKPERSKEKSRKKKKEENEKKLFLSPSDLGPILSVPGTCSKNEARMKLNAIYGHFGLSCDNEKEEEIDKDDDNAMDVN